uniref:uncharacterized protein LOC100181907 isoform X2 n=1 Tax=Ciona intestinalis TaxID=7719 RepID=UPI000EF45DBB|nr:uncharacterized protein LOC100181907 isoform X2 [Ciona intestinalis]|eukprot:XP_026690246.1 uncharacterized protein LOC100181907 isoform X2 [Ciona intestinalis]
MDPDDQSLETSSSFSPTEVTFTTVSPVHYEAPPRLNIVEQIVVPVLYCIISFIGLIGNGIVLYIMRHMNKSVTDVYVTNLAVADILLLGTLPFWAAEHVMGRWVFGTIMCKIASCMTYMNMYASIFFLAIMSLDRWLAIVKAIKCRTLRTVQKAWIISSLIWGLSLFFMILPSLFRTTKQYRHGDRCVWEFPKGMTYHLNVLYNVLRSIVGFFLPLIVIVFCYSDLVRFMRKRSKIRKKSSDSAGNNKVTQMVLVVVSCFIISWLPNQVTNFVHLLKLLGVVSYGCKPPSMRISSMSAFTTNFPFTDSTTSITGHEVQWLICESCATNRDFPPAENKLQIDPSGATTRNGLLDLPAEIGTNATDVDRLLEITSSLAASEPCVSGRTIMYIHLFTACLGFSNSMMNPVVYSFMGAMFRKKLFQLITCAPESGGPGRNRRTSMWTSMRHTTTTRIRNSTVSLGRKKRPSTAIAAGGRNEREATSLRPASQPIWTRKQNVVEDVRAAPAEMPDGLFPDYDDDDEEDHIHLKPRCVGPPVTKRRMKNGFNQQLAKKPKNRGITGVSECNDSDSEQDDQADVTLGATQVSPLCYNYQEENKNDKSITCNGDPEENAPCEQARLLSNPTVAIEVQTLTVHDETDFGGVWAGLEH